MEKLCTKCSKIFPIEVFGQRKDRNNRPHSWCNICRSRNLKAVQDNRRVKTEFLRTYKEERGCCVCGLNVAVALDFHHLDPTTKDSTVANLLSNHHTIERMMKEMAKCVVICANHHRMLHEGLITL